ncbi:MAG TPA: hypothetical protein VMZ53_26955 [Kofleriaceae bacterium]|nr:hypothetical protein [Kofleriaceae bacterium]
MKRLLLLPLVFAAACSDQPTKEESVRVWSTASISLSNAQTQAVTAAKTGGTGSTDVNLNYTGACTLGGSVAVTGNYAGEGDDEHAAFDLSASFDGCKDVSGSLDGDIHWTSTADAAGFTAGMTGSLAWTSGSDSATCDFDLHLAVTQSAITYGGTLCGYTMAELGLSVGH